MTRHLEDPDLAAIWSDGLSASRPQRQAYRDAFGLTPGQRLLLVSSTWGQDSLHGRWPALVDMLAQQLPLDNWRVAVMLHPTLCRDQPPEQTPQTSWRIRRWCDKVRQDGVLTLIDSDAASGIAALVAADVVIGDHGSVSLFATAQGIPVVLVDTAADTPATTPVDTHVGTPVDTVGPGAAVSELLRLAPRLAPGELARMNGHHVGLQIELAITKQDPEAPKRLLPMPGRHIVEDLVDVVADIVGPDGRPRTTPAPVPTTGFPEPTSTLVRTDLHLVDHQLDVVAHRYPAGSLARPYEMPPETHLVTDALTPEPGLLTMSDVVVHHAVPDARRWARSTLRELPGCQLAAACDPDGWLLSVPDRSTPLQSIRSVRLHAPTRGHVFASAARDWLAAGCALTDLPNNIRLHLAGQTVTAEVVPA